MCSVSRRQHSEGGSDIVEWDTGPPNREHLATSTPQGQRAPRGHRQAGRAMSKMEYLSVCSDLERQLLWQQTKQRGYRFTRALRVMQCLGGTEAEGGHEPSTPASCEGTSCSFYFQFANLGPLSSLHSLWRWRVSCPTCCLMSCRA